MHYGEPVNLLLLSQDTDESCTHHVGRVVDNAGGYIPCYTSVQALWGIRRVSGCVCVDIQCFIVRVSVIIGLPFSLTGVDHTFCDKWSLYRQLPFEEERELERDRRLCV